MSKYTITHACGHTTTQQLYGAHTERDRKVAWWETVDCPACYGRKKDEERNNARRIAEDKVNEWQRQGIYVGAVITNVQTQASLQILEIDSTHEDLAVVRVIDSGKTARLPVSKMIEAIIIGKVVSSPAREVADI